MVTAKQVLILGGGFGGLTSATLIRKSLSQEECQITVIDKNQYFMMGFVNLWILSGRQILVGQGNGDILLYRHASEPDQVV